MVTDSKGWHEIESSNDDALKGQTVIGYYYFGFLQLDIGQWQYHHDNAPAYFAQLVSAQPPVS